VADRRPKKSGPDQTGRSRMWPVRGGGRRSASSRTVTASLCSRHAASRGQSASHRRMFALPACGINGLSGHSRAPAFGREANPNVISAAWLIVSRAEQPAKIVDNSPPRNREGDRRFKSPSLRGGDSNSKLSSDVGRYQIPRFSLTSKGNRREPKQSRISGEQISGARIPFFGPNSAPNSGGIPPIKAQRVSGVQIPLSPPMSLRSPALSRETHEIRASARVPTAVRAPERPLGCLQRRIRPWFLHCRS